MSEATTLFASLSTSIRDLGSQLDVLRQSDTKVTSYQQVAQEAKTLAARLGDSLAQWRALVDAGIPCEAKVDWAATAAAALAETVAPAALDPQAVGAALESLKRAHKAQLRALHQAVDHAWAEHVSSALARVPASDHLDLVEQTDPQRVSRLRQIRARIVSLKEEVPTSAAGCNEVGRLSEEAAELTSQLKDVPAEVRVFLSRVASGFPLEELSAPILDWLTNHEMLERYVVQPRRGYPTGGRRS